MKCFLTLFAVATNQSPAYPQIPDETPGTLRCQGGPPLRGVLPLIALAVTPCIAFAQGLSEVWAGYAHDARHTGTSTIASQSLHSIHWQTPVDQNPPGGGSGPLFVHYGSPVITAANTIIVPLGNNGNGFQLNAFNGATGAALYTLTTDYTLPSHDWTPPYGPAIALGTRLFYPGAGGTLYYRDLPNSPTGPNGQSGATGQFAFYGIANYLSHKALFNNAIQISTPLTADRSGNIYFGFTVTGANPPMGLSGGIARVSFTGVGTWASAVSLTNDHNANQIALNCAPALSVDNSIVYIATSNGAEFGTGYLASMNATNLSPIAHVALNDPRGIGLATVSTDSSASPMVGPDGDVYYGVLEFACCSSHNDRGWLLHFNSALSQIKTPGSFGWDDTASVVPSSAVPSYSGSSSYLLLTKYNNYVGVGNGNGANRVAILDPTATMTDEYPGPTYPAATVMQEVITVLGVTPNGSAPSVREWCINTAAIDPNTKSAIVNSEDGTVYRWNFVTNTLSQSLNLTTGRGEAYTPTVIGPDGTVYAVNDAILFAVGN